MKIPWGAWKYISSTTCVWEHNPNLKMTADEQYRENVKNGYLDNGIIKKGISNA